MTVNGSTAWYEKAVRKAYPLGPGSCDSLFARFLTKKERHTLWMKSNFKTKVKWFVLQKPMVYAAVQNVTKHKLKKKQ